MDWNQIFLAVSGIFGTGGIGTYLLADQRIRHNKKVNELEQEKMKSDLEASISKTQLQVMEALQHSFERAESRARDSEARVLELTQALNVSNQRIAKLEICLIQNNIQLPL